LRHISCQIHFMRFDSWSKRWTNRRMSVEHKMNISHSYLLFIYINKLYVL